MTDSPREQLWRRVSTPRGEEDEDGPPLGVDGPRPGTLWVHPATPLEWLVVEREPDRILLMPADTDPVLGVYDVQIPAEDSAGPLSVRCRLGRWVPESLLLEAQASGVVSEKYLAEARDHFYRPAHGQGEDAMLGPDGGPSPDYEDLVAELQRAWNRLDRRLPADLEARRPSLGFLPTSDLGARRLRRAWVALVFVVGAGGAWCHGRLSANTDLPFFPAFAEFLSSRGDAPAMNFTRLVWTTAVTRGPGGGEELYLPPGSEYVLIYIILDTHPPPTDYRLALWDLADRRVVWQAEGLKVIEEPGGPTLSIALPASAFAFDHGTDYAIEIESRDGRQWNSFLRRRVHIRKARSTGS